jgi:hypothetical protein
MRISISKEEATKLFTAHIKELMSKGQSPKDAVHNSCKVLGIKLNGDSEFNLIKSLEHEQARLRAALDSGMIVQNGIVVEKVKGDDYKDLENKKHLESKKVG